MGDEVAGAREDDEKKPLEEQAETVPSIQELLDQYPDDFQWHEPGDFKKRFPLECLICSEYTGRHVVLDMRGGPESSIGAHRLLGHIKRNGNHQFLLQQREAAAEEAKAGDRSLLPTPEVLHKVRCQFGVISHYPSSKLGEIPEACDLYYDMRNTRDQMRGSLQSLAAPKTLNLGRLADSHKLYVQHSRCIERKTLGVVTC